MIRQIIIFLFITIDESFGHKKAYTAIIFPTSLLHYQLLKKSSSIWSSLKSKQPVKKCLEAIGAILCLLFMVSWYKKPYGNRLLSIYFIFVASNYLILCTKYTYNDRIDCTEKEIEGTVYYPVHLYWSSSFYTESYFSNKNVWYEIRNFWLSFLKNEFSDNCLVVS